MYQENVSDLPSRLFDLNVSHTIVPEKRGCSLVLEVTLYKLHAPRTQQSSGIPSDGGELRPVTDMMQPLRHLCTHDEHFLTKD